MSASVSATPGAGAPVHRDPRQIRLVWSVSRGALARSREGIEPGAGVADLTLEITFGANASGETVLRCGSAELARAAHAPGVVVVTSDPDRRLEHVDIEGVVACTRRGSEVIFARAPVLASLGLGGGRYELDRTKDAERWAPGVLVRPDCSGR